MKICKVEFFIKRKVCSNERNTSTGIRLQKVYLTQIGRRLHLHCRIFWKWVRCLNSFKYKLFKLWFVRALFCAPIYEIKPFIFKIHNIATSLLCVGPVSSMTNSWHLVVQNHTFNLMLNSTWQCVIFIASSTTPWGPSL